jgi:hypothetical protein
MIRFVLVIVVVASVLLGCAMLTAWQSIPPPGGCDQCHKFKISANWVASFESVKSVDETGQITGQKSGTVLDKTILGDMEPQEVPEQYCFRCHKSPDGVHLDYKGSYHR